MANRSTETNNSQEWFMVLVPGEAANNGENTTAFGCTSFALLSSILEPTQDGGGGGSDDTALIGM